MAIEELVAIVKPPERPLETGDPEQWRLLQKEIGLDFPSDWYDLAMLYGTGRFGGELEVFNPFSAKYPEIIKAKLAFRQRDRESPYGPYDVGRDQPYPVYPDRPGLYPFGRDYDGDTLYWFTDGRAEEWPIVLVTSEGEAGEYNMSMTTFLARAYNGEIQEPLSYELLDEGLRVFIQPDAG